MKLKLHSAHKTYKDAGRVLKVIDDLSFEFPENKSIAIVGRSGIGKTTLLHLLGGLDRATAGAVFFDNKDIAELSDDELAEFRGRNIGFVFQFHHLLPEFTAVENVAMPLIIRGEKKEFAHEQARMLLDRVGLAERLRHRPGQLSGGEQQRVAVARALIGRPAVLLADEPTGNLDSDSADRIQELLLELHRQFENTLIIVTHNLKLAGQLDLQIEMNAGGKLRYLSQSEFN